MTRPETAKWMWRSFRPGWGIGLPSGTDTLHWIGDGSALAMPERAIASGEEAEMIPAITLCDLSFLETSQLQDK